MRGKCREAKPVLVIKKTGNGLWQIGINSFQAKNDIILHREERALSIEFMQSDETKRRIREKENYKR